jgi:hypothetical protein
MWKICQEPAPNYKVIIDDFKPLPRQNRQRNLADFIAGLGILRIEGKKRKRPLTQRPFPLDGAEYGGKRGLEEPSGSGSLNKGPAKTKSDHE